MQTPEINGKRLQEYHTYIENRFNVYKSRKAGLKPPWTSDAVLQSSAFVNVFRDWDVTSDTAASIMTRLKDADLIVTGVAMALTNKPATMREIGPLSQAVVKNSTEEVDRIT